MSLDIFYILGLLVVWFGNIRQIQKLVKTKSTKSFSMAWLVAMFLSIALRLPRAVTSSYWVWQWGYGISFTVILALSIVAIYYRRKYPRK